MKLCYLSTFYPFRGGIAQFNASLFREFEKEHEIEAVTFTRQYPNILFPGESQYVTGSDNPDVIDSKEWLDSINPFTWIHTAKRIRKINPDLLVMKYWMPFFGPSLGYVAGHLPKHSKSIAILDNVIPHEKHIIDMPFTRYFLKRVNGFVVMSKIVQDDLLSLKPDAKYIQHEYPLYDHFGVTVEKSKAQQALKLDEHKKTLLFFGFIRRYKGLDLLIDAFGKLDNSYQLIIAGESYGSFDSYDKQINKNPNKAGIHKYVRYISDEEVPLFFSAADACILPYKSATQSGITSIAYHFELPILATDVGGLKEIVRDGETGKIITEANIGDIEAGIRGFFDENKQSVYRENIRKIKSKMSWKNLATEIIRLNEKL